MTDILEKEKRRAIHRIQKIDSLAEMRRVTEVLENGGEKADLNEVILTSLKHKTLDELAEEQNVKPMDWEEFSRLAKKIDIQEPIELLLEQLKG